MAAVNTQPFAGIALVDQLMLGTFLCFPTVGVARAFITLEDDTIRIRCTGSQIAARALLLQQDITTLPRLFGDEDIAVDILVGANGGEGRGGAVAAGTQGFVIDAQDDVVFTSGREIGSLQGHSCIHA